MSARDAMRRAEDVLELLETTPMGMRVKSGPWLRGQLHAACRDVIEMGRKVRVLDDLGEALKTPEDWMPDD